MGFCLEDAFLPLISLQASFNIFLQNIDNIETDCARVFELSRQQELPAKVVFSCSTMTRVHHDEERVVDDAYISQPLAVPRENIRKRCYFLVVSGYEQLSSQIIVLLRCAVGFAANRSMKRGPFQIVFGVALRNVDFLHHDVVLQGSGLIIFALKHRIKDGQKRVQIVLYHVREVVSGSCPLELEIP